MDIENKINGLIKIINSEATLMIYNYMVIEKTVTPATLRKTLNISKASVFRSIDLLVSCDIITKKVLKVAIDGSKQAYTIINPLETTIDEIRSSEYYNNNGELVNEWNENLINFTDALNSAGKKVLQEHYDGTRLDLYTMIDLEINEDILEEIFALLDKIPRKPRSQPKIAKPMSISLSICGDIKSQLPEYFTKRVLKMNITENKSE